jgi:TolB-like protein/Flp pilus assembly protein TadD
MQIWSAEIKELEVLYTCVKGKFPDLEKELGHLIKTDDENVALLYSRRCLEVIITDLCETELQRPRKTEPLKGIIDKLHKEEKVPSHIITSMHGLNDLSTYGTHPKEYYPEQVKPVLNNLATIVKWYLKYMEAKADFKTKPAKEINLDVKTNGYAKNISIISKKRIVVLASGLILLFVIVVTILFFTNLIGKDKSEVDIEKSIAVLPFKNLTNDPDQEYFSEGMVDEILDKLFKIGDLKIISRTSSERFRNTDLSIKEIAHELGVSAILEGSVRKMGNKVRITVQLIDAGTDTHLWSEIYDRDISEIFSIQSEVAQTVARELKAVITPQTKQLIEKKPTADTEAYDAYLNGRFYLSKGTQNDFATAMQYFELAKERDPEFALAYAGIARVWNSRKQAGFARVSEATPQAEAAIKKALELDSTLSDVHQALAGIKTWTRWDWKGGEASFRKAIELNPNNADAHSSYSHLLNILGRPGEAMKQIEIALELDPLNPKIKSFYGVDLMFVHRYDEAVKAFRESLDLNPAQGVAVINIVNALALAGREKEAIEMLRSRWKDNNEYLKVIDEGYTEAGFKGAMRKLADLSAENTKITHVNQTGPAQYYTWAGDVNNALYWLEKAYEEQDPNLPYLLIPIYDGLRDDPRFQEIARKMNLPYK